MAERFDEVMLDKNTLDPETTTEIPPKNHCALHPSRMRVWSNRFGRHAWECGGCVDDAPIEADWVPPVNNCELHPRRSTMRESWADDGWVCEGCHYGDPVEEGRLFVDKYYETDSSTEDILFDGSDLYNGMNVLIEDREERQEILSEMTASMIDRAKERNCWAVISNVTWKGDSVSFIATYSDGSKRKRRHSIESAWLIKKDVVERIEETDSDGKKFEEISGWVKGTLLFHAKLSVSDEQIEDVSNSLTRKIFASLVGEGSHILNESRKKPVIVND